MGLQSSWASPMDFYLPGGWSTIRKVGGQFGVKASQRRVGKWGVYGKKKRKRWWMSYLKYDGIWFHFGPNFRDSRIDIRTYFWRRMKI